MKYQIRYAALALDDLDALRAWIESEADGETASRYIERVRRKINTLVDYPKRGTPRDDLKPGVRAIGFEGNLLIFYVVADDTVEIVHVVSGVRDLRRLFVP